METVPASLTIELNVRCPECGHFFELMQDTDLNEEGWLIDRVIPDARWKIDADERLECVAYCPECSVAVEIKGVEW